MSTTSRPRKGLRRAFAANGALLVIAIAGVFGTGSAGAAPKGGPAPAPATADATARPADVDTKSTAESSKPIDVVIVVDNSNRLSAQMETIRTAAASYANALPVTSRVSIVTTGGFPVVTRDLTPVGTDTNTAIANIGPAGSPALFDGIELGLNQFEKSVDSIHRVVVLSDGRDEASTLPLDRIRGLIKSNKVKLDVVSIPSGQAVLSVLEQLAKEGKGRIVPATNRVEVAALAENLKDPVMASKGSAPAPKGSKGGLLSSPIALVLGGLAVFGALAFGVMTMFGAKPEQVELVKSTAKPQRSTITDITERLSAVADRRLERSGKSGRLTATLDAAGINMKGGEYTVLVFAAILTATFLGFLMFKPLGGPIFGVLAFVGSRGYVSFRASRRRSEFDAQLSDTVGLLSSSMRSGQGLLQAIDGISKQADAPSSQEFARIVVETRLGKDVVQALYDLADRMDSTDLRWTIPAIEINRSAGGDLGEVLDNVGRTIRDRADLRRQVKALSAEGRFSAYVLVALPIGVTAMISIVNPGYVAELKTGIGLIMAVCGGISMAIGSWWLFKLCKIKF